MALSGIDVSELQGGIEWHRVAAAGNYFAYIRGAYGDYTDKMAVQNFLAARSENVLCGLYHFYRATRSASAQQDAMVNVLRKANFGKGDLPPVIDVEDNPYYDGPWNNQNNSRYVQDLLSWLARMTAEFNCTPIIYTRASFWTQIGTPSGFERYPLWVANYGVSTPILPSSWANYQFWQYSEAGTVDGISGRCDLDYFNGGLPALRALTMP
jgi:lysozyme